MFCDFVLIDLLSCQLLRNLRLNQKVLLCHRNVAHILYVSEVWSTTLACLVRANIWDEEIARVQIVGDTRLVEQTDG